ncbi:8027_t:CDS:2, partial [Funneliformis geosporum]
MVEIKNKKLANLIKSDLQDVLTNDNRRLAKLEQKYVKRYGKPYQEGELDRIEKQNKLVLKDELEAQDWQEIINLMDQINPLKEQKDQVEKTKLDAKLATGRGKRSYGDDDEGRGWYNFTIIKNGQEYLIYVPKEHSALTNFPFDTEGFHIISGIDHLPIAEKRKYWWIKIVGLNDQIIITPYEVENNSKPENQNKEGECDICHKNLKPGQEGVYLGQYHGNNKAKRIHVCHDCYQSKEQEYLQNYAFIYSYELDYKGKGGTGYLKNSELVSARNIFQKSNQPKLTKEDLEKMLNANSTPTQNPKGDHSLLVGCLIGAGLILAFGMIEVINQVGKVVNNLPLNSTKWE